MWGYVNTGYMGYTVIYIFEYAICFNAYIISVIFLGKVCLNFEIIIREKKGSKYFVKLKTYMLRKRKIYLFTL